MGRWTQHWAGWLFAGLGLLLPIMVLFAPRTPTALAVLAAAASAVIIVTRRPAFRLPAPGVFATLAGLCGFAALSTLWSLDPPLAWQGAAKLLGHIVVGLLLIGGATLLTAEERRRALLGLAVGVAAALIILAAESFLGSMVSKLLADKDRDLVDLDFQVNIYGAYWFNAGGSVIAILVWPLGLDRRVGRWVLAPTLSALAATLYGIGFATGALAVVVGAAAALGVALAGRRAVVALMAVMVVAVMLAPVAPRTVLEPERLSAMADLFPRTMLPRFYIWAFAAERIGEKPLAGWGMNASRTMPGGDARIVDRIRDRTYGHVLPLHPHNVALQVWMELGLPGALLLSGLICAVLWAAATVPPARRAPALATGQAVAGIVFMGLSYGAFQSWWISTLWLAAAFTVCGMDGGSASRSRATT